MKAFYKPVTLDERARAYLDTIKKERTRETNQNALKAFYAFRRYHSPAPLAWKDFDFEILVQFGQWLDDHDYNEFSRSTYLACVTEFLKYGVDKGWLPPTFPLERAIYRRRKSFEREPYPIVVPSPRIPELAAYYDRQSLPEPEADTPLERERARVKQLCLLRARAVVHTLLATAARVSEVAKLTRVQVQDGRIINIVITGKRNKQRFMFLTPDAQAAIQAYCLAREDTYEDLFISHGRNKGNRLTRQMLWKIVADAAAALGFECHPHEIRHYRASQMLAEGVPAEAIQKILGHESISTTLQVYAHHTEKGLRDIFDKASKGV